jgi:hypothetical protein
MGDWKRRCCTVTFSNNCSFSFTYDLDALVKPGKDDNSTIGLDGIPSFPSLESSTPGPLGPVYAQRFTSLAASTAK